MKRFLLCALLACGLVAPVLAQNATSDDDIQTQLQQIMKMLEAQQKQIETLQQQVQRQQTIIDQQSQDFQRRTQEFEEQKREIESRPNLNDAVEALVHYKTGSELQHIGRFEVRKRESKPYFNKAIGEFKIVLEEHPSTPQAADCAWRTATIYHKYLKEYKSAVTYYQLLLEEYPQSPHAAEARKNLTDIKGK